MRDRVKIRELWKIPCRAWFPHEADDPSVVLIRIRGEEAEYWDNGVNALSFAYQAVNEMTTGSTPEVKEGEQHGLVRLSP